MPNELAKVSLVYVAASGDFMSRIGIRRFA